VHQVYLSLGSNIQPEVNLPKALDLLYEFGEIVKVSSAWESAAVGSDGPHFLNACALFNSPLLPVELKEQVIQRIETKLGRRRSEDKFAPRTIDIDIVLFDDQLCDDKYGSQAFVVIPLAEIYPNYLNPLTNERIEQTAARLHQQIWMEGRPEVLDGFHGKSA
jgi:2-amino-4-hydroxy-6-hydroxymethyldihydropteridine diphosphokinase